jgi:hypothetical protein
MFEFALATENIPFAIAMSLMLIIGIFEGVGVILGMGLSDVLDSFIPDFEIDTDLEVGEVGSQNALSRLLGWLRVGKVPVLMLLVILLFFFGVIGYSINFLADGLFGFLLPAIVAAPVAFVLSLPCTRAGAGVLQWAMPKDESNAVSTDTFIGRVAHITLGTAREEMAAEAKVQDQYGTPHYIRVRPDDGHGPFGPEQPLLIVRKHGGEFIVIAADSSVSE